MDKKPKIIVFDAYGTIVYNNKPYIGREIKKQLYADGIDKILIKKIWRFLLTGQGNLQEALKFFNINIYSDNTIKEWQSSFLENSKNILPYQETEAVFTYLLNNNYKTVIASNLSLPFAKPLYQLTDCITLKTKQPIIKVFSFEIGFMKPEKTFYTYIEKLFPNSQLDDFFMIGDDLLCDVDSPKSIGWQSCHLKRPDKTLWDCLPFI